MPVRYRYHDALSCIPHISKVVNIDADYLSKVDPTFFVENGHLKLGFGLYWSCISQVTLNIISPAEAPPGVHLADYNGRRAEGSFTYEPASSPYHFEYFPDGITPFDGVRPFPSLPFSLVNK